mmetsp:Transcript_4405/g.12200  ORF Transcript_4405/g.12200 Transcript_4405/m.12200 type:complete len:82 (-) Transcript_4405:60-305(-)
MVRVATAAAVWVRSFVRSLRRRRFRWRYDKTTTTTTTTLEVIVSTATATTAAEEWSERPAPQFAALPISSTTTPENNDQSR